MKKIIDTSWDFKNENTKTYTHCFHAYPAMMIPQIAKRLIESFAGNAKLLFDPYCGTGTSLVEANLHNINAIGTDLNPLARLISKVKTSKMNTQSLDLFIRDYNDFTFQLRFNGSNRKSVIIPKFDNIDFWFQQAVIEDLGIIKGYILEISDENIKNFFKIAFSETVRESSLTRNGEFKLYKKSDKQMKDFKPDAYNIMLTKLLRNRKGYADYIQNLSKNVETQIYDFNTCGGIPPEVADEKTVDIVVTSPPYGDSRTTVAYGQFSRLANEWLDMPEARRIDSNLMGGTRLKEINSFGIQSIDATLDKVKNVDENRALDVFSFYKDLFHSINNVSKIVKKNGYACYVVGNRKVKGQVLPTDEIIVDMFLPNGFTHKQTFIRNIPSKRMPSKNSPTNETGVLDSTMNHEYIVILKKAS